MFKSLNGLFNFMCPHEQDIFLEHISKRFTIYAIVFNKLPVMSREA